MKNEDGKTVIRPSALSAYADTARRTAASSLIRDEILAAGYKLNDFQNSVATSVGTAVHRSAEWMLHEKVRGTYGPGAVTAAVDAGVETFRTELEQGVVWDKVSPNVSAVQAQIKKMAGSYAQFAVPEIEPMAIEERLTVDLGDDFIASGQSDVVAMTPMAVEDLKSGLISRTHAAQLGMYTNIQRSHGRDIRFAQTRFIQRVAKDKDQPPPVVTRYELYDIEPIALNRVRRVKSDITEFRRLVEVGNADPIMAFDCSPASFLCGERFCPLFGTDGCAEWKWKIKEKS